MDPPHKPPNLRIIVPRSIIVQTCLGVEFFASEELIGVGVAVAGFLKSRTAKREVVYCEENVVVLVNVYGCPTQMIREVIDNRLVFFLCRNLLVAGKDVANGFVVFNFVVLVEVIGCFIGLGVSFFYSSASVVVGVFNTLVTNKFNIDMVFDFFKKI